MERIFNITFLVLFVTACGPNVDYSYDNKTTAGVHYRNDSSKTDISYYADSIDPAFNAIKDCTNVDIQPILIVFVDWIGYTDQGNTIGGRYYFEREYIEILPVAQTFSIIKHELVHHALWTAYHQKGHDSPWFTDCL